MGGSSCGGCLEAESSRGDNSRSLVLAGCRPGGLLSEVGINGKPSTRVASSSIAAANILIEVWSVSTSREAARRRGFNLSFGGQRSQLRADRDPDPERS